MDDPMKAGLQAVAVVLVLVVALCAVALLIAETAHLIGEVL